MHQFENKELAAWSHLQFCKAMASCPRPVTSGFPQESVWEAVWFNIFVSDMDNGLQGTLRNFVHVTKLFGTADALERRDATQRDLDNLEMWLQTS